MSFLKTKRAEPVPYVQSTRHTLFPLATGADYHDSSLHFLGNHHLSNHTKPLFLRSTPSLSPIAASIQSIRPRIYDSLAAHFGAGAVFRDVNSLQYGKSFEEQLETTLGECTVLTGIIGPLWLKLLEQKAGYGEDVPDYCLKEILFAIDRGIPAMPIMIDGAKIPEFHELPEKLSLETRKKLHRFFRNHAFHLPEDDAAFADGLVRLRSAVQKLVGQSH